MRRSSKIFRGKFLSLAFFISLSMFTYAAPTPGTPKLPVFLKYPGRSEYSIPTRLSHTATMNCSVQNPSSTTITWFRMKARKNLVPVAPGNNDKFVKKLRVKKTVQYMCNVSNSAGYKTRKFIVRVLTFFQTKPLVQDLFNVTVTKGKTAQLKCLAVGHAMPHMQFFKTVNGTQHNVRDLKELENRTTTKVISADIKTEFFKLYLWIHNVTKDDEGKYTCKAGNFFGKAEKDLYVHVVSAYPSPTPGTLKLPVFLKYPGWSEYSIPTPHSHTATMNCSVRNPSSTTITWFRMKARKNLVPVPPGSHDKFVKKLRNVKKTVEYMCNVSNSAGYKTRKFIVRVFTFFQTKPLVQDLVNVTVTKGETAQLKCLAAGDAMPHMQFFKTVNGTQYKVGDLKKLENRTTTKVISTNIKTEFFKLNLWIHNVTKEDEGKYTCKAGNSIGLTEKDLYLIVLSAYPSSLHTKKPGIKGWEIAIIVVGVACFVAAVVAVCIYNRWHFKRKLFKKEEEIRIAYEIESHSLPQSPVKRFLAMNSVRSSSGSLTGELIFRSQVASYGDDFAHISIPLDRKWEIERKHVRIDGQLGEGAFGRVLKATAIGVPGLPQRHTVAIKTLKENSTEAELVDLLSEMNMMKNIGKHKNIVNLIGCCTQNGPLLMVIEYAKFGNLRQFLRDRRPTHGEFIDTSTEEDSSADGEKRPSEEAITLSDLVSFAFQIARGMEYLESNKCVHRDLAARNILVSEDKVLKVADFGLARDVHAMDYYRKTTNGRLPVKWMAIEALFDRVYSSKSDVWGFGVVLWEIFTFGGTPYPSLPVEDLFELLQSGYRMEKPHNCPQNIYEVMLNCWAESPLTRPTFTNLVQIFDSILTNLLSSQYIDTGSSTCERLLSGTSSNDSSGEHIAHLVTLSNDSVFQRDSEIIQAEERNLHAEQTSGQEPSTSRILPSSSYELLSARAPPSESDV